MAQQPLLAALAAALLPSLLLLLLHTDGGASAAKNAPVWPSMYQVSFNLSVPYIDKLQEGGLTYTYTYFRDEVNGRQKMVRDGVETTLIDLSEMKRYDVLPAKDHWRCWVSKLGGHSGPTLAQPAASSTAAPPTLPSVDDAGQQPGGGSAGTDAAAAARRRRLLQAGGGEGRAGSVSSKKPKFTPEQLKNLGFLLPDLREVRWRRNGTAQARDGRSMERYSYQLREDKGYGEVAVQYDFLVDADGAPFELRMWGINLFTGGHFDDYRVRFTGYDAQLKGAAFAIDKSACSDELDDGASAALGSALHLPGTAAAHAASVLPSAHHGDADYDVFVHRSGRRHAGRWDYEARRSVFHGNLQFIEEWNAGNHSHTCAMNRFGDWSRDERRRLFRPAPRPEVAFLTAAAAGAAPSDGDYAVGKKKAHDWKHMRPHNATVPFHFLPAEVDWRGTPADSPVKDQAMCGSCWAFSTVQALESAYYRARGEQLLLSEQHLLDCAWNVPENKGCFGGQQTDALEWAFDTAFVASEASLPYFGTNQFCPEHADGITFRGYWSLVPPGEQAVMEALLSAGPLTVSIDASQPDMSFYSSGVYANPKCQTSADGLDHAVILSGYGHDDGGLPYWIVKNTWSTNWGEGGFLRVSRSPDDCGIAAEAMYATFSNVELEEGHRLE